MQFQPLTRGHCNFHLFLHLFVLLQYIGNAPHICMITLYPLPPVYCVPQCLFGLHGSCIDMKKQQNDSIARVLKLFT